MVRSSINDWSQPAFWLSFSRAFEELTMGVIGPVGKASGVLNNCLVKPSCHSQNLLIIERTGFSYLIPTRVLAEAV